MKLKFINKLLIVLSLTITQAYAQASLKRELNQPQSVKEVCIEIEGSIVSLYKASQNAAAKGVATDNPQEWKRLSSVMGTADEIMAKREASWERLGCALILYGKK